MALTLNQFCGFETGGNEEATGGVSTTPAPDSTEAMIVRSGARSLRLDGTGTATYDINLFDDVADAGTGHVFGFGVYLETGVTPSSAVVIAQALNDAAGVVCQVELQTDGSLHLLDSVGAIAVNGTDTLVIDRWYYIEVYFVESATGASSMNLDGASGGTDGTSDDFLNGTLNEFRFGSTSALDGDIIIDDFYWLSGATAASDRLGDGVSVYGYQSGKVSQAPDFDSAGVEGGDNISQINWRNTGDRPWNDTNFVQYAPSGALNGCVAFNDVNTQGDSPGPASGSDIVSGIIKGAKYAFRGDRSGGGGTTHSIVYGKYDGVGDMDDAPQVDVVTLLQGTLTHFFVVTEAAAEVPTADEDFVMGLDKSSGGRDWDCYEMQAFLLHVSETVVTDLSDGKMPEYPSHGLTVEVDI